MACQELPTQRLLIRVMYCTHCSMWQFALSRQRRLASQSHGWETVSEREELHPGSDAGSPFRWPPYLFDLQELALYEIEDAAGVQRLL